MKKTIDDYLNDPDLAREPQSLREVHAARLMIQDETNGMTAEERTAYYHEAAIRFFAPNKPPGAVTGSHREGP
ncbi:MAG: hypothetical protein FWG29_04165 [Treponema sp.]|nr:hypothetical protein [Treponema sp.]